jgi:uncharacterized protein YqhQ
MTPGLALQRCTTREPTLEQYEVAITSLLAVMIAEQLAEVNARTTQYAPGSQPGFRTA